MTPSLIHEVLVVSSSLLGHFSILHIMAVIAVYACNKSTFVIRRAIAYTSPAFVINAVKVAHFPHSTSRRHLF